MGGGEKVLYKMLEGLFVHQTEIEEKLGRKFHVAIYSSALELSGQIISRVKARFNIDLPEEKIEFIRIKRGEYLHPNRYGTLTLLRQALSSSLVILEALTRHPSDMMLDTMGFGWIYPVAKLICPGLKVLSYSHYPFISSDMIHKVDRGVSDFNNASSISSSRLKTKLKTYYYRLILLMYRFVGRFADLVMTNSTWTYNHFADLWSSNAAALCKLYPPCTVDKYLEMPLERHRRQQILSIGQFRPEKNHKLQIRTLKKVIDSDLNRYKELVLVIAGSCRAKDDEKRLEELQEYVQSLDLIDHVVFRKNVEWKDLYNEMKQSMIGIHTMQDEHFGIVVVELIAAGLVTIAHNSAGPKYDIIQGNTKGFLAENEEDFAKHVKNVLDHYDDEEMKTLRRNAREHSKTFSDEAFIDKFMGIFEGFMENAYRNKKIKAH